MDVSVIIVNYNTRDLTLNCIKSIKEQTFGLNYEIIVVDNASVDNSILTIEKEFPDVCVISSTQNLGFGRANNLGTSKSTGKYLFYLNSDTLLVNNAIKIFFDFAESSNERIGAIGCILKDLAGNNIHSFGPFINFKNEAKILFTKYFRFLKDKEITSPQSLSEPKEVDYITGADLFVPRYVFDTIGGFDPIFFMYCEETDWEQRMAYNGYKRIVIPGPKIIHLEGGSDSNVVRTWTSSRMIRNRTSKIKYYKKYYCGISLFLFRLFLYIMEAPITLYLTLKYPFKGYGNLYKLF